MKRLKKSFEIKNYVVASFISSPVCYMERSLKTNNIAVVIIIIIIIIIITIYFITYMEFTQ